MMERQPTGTLILIGGYEDKHQERSILQQVAQAAPVAMKASRWGHRHQTPGKRS